MYSRSLSSPLTVRAGSTMKGEKMMGKPKLPLEAEGWAALVSTN